MQAPEEVERWLFHPCSCPSIHPSPAWSCREGAAPVLPLRGLLYQNLLQLLTVLLFRRLTLLGGLLNLTKEQPCSAVAVSCAEGMAAFPSRPRCQLR